MKSRQISVAAGATVAVFSTLSLTFTAKVIQVHLVAASSGLYVAENSSGDNPSFRLSSSPSDPTMFQVKNEDLFIKNPTGGPIVLSVAAFDIT